MAAYSFILLSTLLWLSDIMAAVSGTVCASEELADGMRGDGTGVPLGDGTVDGGGVLGIPGEGG